MKTLSIVLILLLISCKKEEAPPVKKSEPINILGEDEDGNMKKIRKALREEKFEEVKNLLYAGAPEEEAQSQVNQLINEFGMANVVLWSSAPIGDFGSVKQAVEAGAKIDIEIRGPGTPLLAACQGQHMEIIKYLLDKKANPNARGAQGATPLSLAVSAKNKELVDLLLKAGASFTRGGDPAYKEFSILTVALSTGNVDMVEYLLEKGADPNGGNGLPLAFSIMLKNKKAINLLAKKGANINFKGKKGFRPLMTAVIEGDREIIKLLLDLGADHKLKDEGGKDAFDWAKKYKSKGGDTLKELLAQRQKDKK